MTFLQAGQKQMGLEDQTSNYHIDITESQFISTSPVMSVIHEKIKDLANSDENVLILGRKSSGQSSTAYEIFNQSSCSGQFFKINLKKLNKKDIKAKLFGEKKQQGFLDFNSESVLFLKKIDHLDLSLQKKLVDFFVNKGDKVHPRLICSAKEDLSQKVKKGEFSQKLFEILSQKILILPDLSERAEDIPHFISLFNKENGFQGYMSEKAIDLLKQQPWRGNILELKTVCDQLIHLHGSQEVINSSHVLDIIDSKKTTVLTKYNPDLCLEDLINDYIQMSLDHFGCKKESATALGISVKTLYNKIKTGKIIFTE